MSDVLEIFRRSKAALDNDGYYPAPPRKTPLSAAERARWRKLLAPLYTQVVLHNATLRSPGGRRRR